MNLLPVIIKSYIQAFFIHFKSYIFCWNYTNHLEFQHRIKINTFKLYYLLLKQLCIYLIIILN